MRMRKHTCVEQRSRTSNLPQSQILEDTTPLINMQTIIVRVKLLVVQLTPQGSASLFPRHLLSFTTAKVSDLIIYFALCLFKQVKTFCLFIFAANKISTYSTSPDCSGTYTSVPMTLDTCQTSAEYSAEYTCYVSADTYPYPTVGVNVISL